ncbi:MAG: tRNA pseudouridine(38-40) synthase TruA [Acidobacteriota bacterium]|nr:tRNA pseudouridine(38-40) synthase TruA [Acidobacteriota bacterium]MDQ7086774.1 tRNA pseudouridine(38-40) synthase TruA [Acidobacteriota bacterium]
MTGQPDRSGSRSGARPIVLQVAYDGSGYEGWQLQPGRPTVQGELERALGVIHGTAERIPVVGSSRTDAGVHALGQVASYRPPSPRSIRALAAGLAKLLPPAIRVLAVAEAPEGFHPCRSAVGKTYRYRIVNRPLMLPFERHWAWHLRAPLDTGAMERAAAALVGRHDFTSFATAGGPERDNTRHLRRLNLRLSPDRVLEIEAQADGFLYRMVRNLAGFLVEVGRGRIEADRSGEILRARSRALVGHTAPARGLCLVQVDFPPQQAPW